MHRCRGAGVGCRVSQGPVGMLHTMEIGSNAQKESLVNPRRKVPAVVAGATAFRARKGAVRSPHQAPGLLRAELGNISCGCLC